MRDVPLPRPWLVDAHCDAAMKAVDQGADLLQGSPGLHVSLDGLLEADVRVQVFAACAIYPKTALDRVAARGEAMLDAVTSAAARSDGRMRVVRTASDISRALESPGVNAILALEGADPLEGKAEALRAFAERGVRMVSPAWSDNAFAGTAFGKGAGLAREGERLVGTAEELGVIVDVSHLSDRAFDDVLRCATRPVVATHSNVRTLCPHPRNLTDAMIRGLADAGGVVGINLAPHFLDRRYMQACEVLRAEVQEAADAAAAQARVAERRRLIPRPTLDAFVQHVLHAIRVGGEDAVGIGGDLDGIEATPQGIASVRDMAEIPAVLARAGLTRRQIEKVAHGNFMRVFCEALRN
ncbi:MAG: membrane dipeptidase [Candidatus Bipolaricaulota bacterium]